MGYIFVSYSHKDKAAISRLVDTIKASGYVVWFDHDTEAIPGGSLWREEIVGAIEKADTFLLALSPQSVESDEVRKELDVAEETKRPIVPIVVQTTTIPQKMAYQLAGRQQIDLTVNWDEGVNRLLYALRKAGKANIRVKIGLSEEGQKQMQSILEDHTLSMVEKTRRFQLIWKAESKKNEGEIKDKWNGRTELENRRDKVWAEIKSTDQRIQGLYRELCEQTLRKPTKELLERKIQELDQKRAVLWKEMQELDKELSASKLINEAIHDLEESRKRMSELTNGFMDDAHRLLEKIFEKEE